MSKKCAVKIRIDTSGIEKQLQELSPEAAQQLRDMLASDPSCLRLDFLPAENMPASEAGESAVHVIRVKVVSVGHIVAAA